MIRASIQLPKRVSFGLPSRRLLSLLASCDEICSCDLDIPLGNRQPTVSHHTKLLAEAGLVVGEQGDGGSGGEWSHPPGSSTQRARG